MRSTEEIGSGGLPDSTDDCRTFRDEVPFVYVILRGRVRHAERRDWSPAADFPNQRADIRQIVPVSKCWPPCTTDDSVNLIMRTRQYSRMGCERKK